ncbi:MULTISPECIES: DsbA family protein [unclassified Streptomyces]|uniref:DsbA family protein n=1 Tax=unclassified Streptomyces TaxID=2593676 RepID=UPI0038636C28|nr:DsbA family protein [Streptomyces sp. NBC_00827]
MPAPERASLTYAFAEDNAHRIQIGVVSAGLYTRALPTAAHPHLSAERGTVRRLTGVAFGAGYDRALSQGTTVLDSVAAAAGPASLRDQPGISDLDADAVTAALSSPTSRVKARAGFRALRRLRVHSYPTLLLDTAHGADQMGDAGSTAASLTSALDQRLTTTIPQVPFHDLPSQGEPS